MVVIGVVSQKGGVGKSAIARSIACEAQKSGLSVKIADLDVQQGTSVNWHRDRLNNGYDPVGSVELFGKVSEALKLVGEYDILILDGAPRASAATLEIAQQSDLLILPTGATADDLNTTIKLAHELTAKGISKDIIRMALIKVLSEASAIDAKAYIKESGYECLDGHIIASAGYGLALDKGLALTETSFKTLNAKADLFIQSIGDNL